jgi:adenylate kinase
MRIIGIGGEPGVGKTTFMRRVIDRLGKGKVQKLQLLKLTNFAAARVMVLGVYDPKQKFSGTDVLPMNVQPEAEGFVRAMAKNKATADWTILFEGDRLFNGSFLTVCESVCECRWVVLYAQPETVEERRQSRGTTQDKTWLAGRRSKVANVMAKHKALLVDCERGVPEPPGWFFDAGLPVDKAA